jgi:hypothetical protein
MPPLLTPDLSALPIRVLKCHLSATESALRASNNVTKYEVASVPSILTGRFTRADHVVTLYSPPSSGGGFRLSLSLLS